MPPSEPVAEGDGTGLIARLLRGESIEVAASGGSMFPVIRNGDRVSVEPIGQRPLAPGDIAFAVVGSVWVLHRVVHSTGDTLVLRGDARLMDDAPIPRVAAIGRATWARRGRVRLPLDWPAPLGRSWLRGSRAVAHALAVFSRWRRRSA